MSDINKIKARLDALLRKARDGGSSDAEVMQAMAAAEKIMAKYQISEADLEKATSNDYRKYAYEKAAGRKNFDPVIRYCAGSVCKMTGCVGVHKSAGVSPKSGEVFGEQIILFGLDADVEYATWLLSAMQAFLNDQWETYKNWRMPSRLSRAEITAEKIGFIRGAIARYNDMLREAMDRGGAIETGNALVVRKTELAERQYEKHTGEALGGSWSGRGNGVGSKAAAGAGYSAAGGFSMGRGVEQGAVAIEDRR